MLRINTQNIPPLLKSLDNWVLWKHETRKAGDKPTKIPYQVNGDKAEADNPATWNSFEAVMECLADSGCEGIGFEFPSDRSLVGIDLDGCRNPETGSVAEWARDIIVEIGSYAEVSPSQTGIKIFALGKSPFDTGRKTNVKNAIAICDKVPGIEVYDQKRYFAVTGQRLKGMATLEDRSEAVAAVCSRMFTRAVRTQATAPQTDVAERARKYIATIAPAISGMGGHNQTFKVACILVLGFGLPEGAAYALLAEWNRSCQPEWSERELWHKIKSANEQPGERNYLTNATPEQLASYKLPSYTTDPSEPKEAPEFITLTNAARKYIDVLKGGEQMLITTGVPDLDYALGGGVEKGEMIVVAARPSHGKSALALQAVHAWTEEKRKTLCISEEMSALMLGRRTLQFISDTPQEHWKSRISDIEQDVENYAADREDCLIVEDSGTIERVIERIEWAVQEHGVECVVVDYAQRIQGGGKSRYEQTSNTSIALKKITLKHNLVLMALCQLNREVESREVFIPRNSDLKDSGQLEQDADVIVHLVWPWKLDSKRPVGVYQLFVGKNKNRPVNDTTIECEFNPSRQRIMHQLPVAEPFNADDYNDWNNR